MSALINTGSGWIAPEDLVSRVSHGRLRDPEAAEQCAQYLRSEHSRQRQKGSSRRKADKKIRQALILAYMRRSIDSRAVDRELEQRVTDQSERLERQSRAIDYLLGFVPKRSRALRAERLNELTEQLRNEIAAAGHALGDVTISVADEKGSETRAAHRFVVSLPGLSRADALALEDQLSDCLFAGVEPTEAPSLSIELRSEP